MHRSKNAEYVWKTQSNSKVADKIGRGVLNEITGALIVNVPSDTYFWSISNLRKGGFADIEYAPVITMESKALRTVCLSIYESLIEGIDYED